MSPKYPFARYFSHVPSLTAEIPSNKPCALALSLYSTQWVPPKLSQLHSQQHMASNQYHLARFPFSPLPPNSHSIQASGVPAIQNNASVYTVSMLARVLSKCLKAFPNVDVLSVVNASDEKYSNCLSVQMIVTKSLNILSQEMKRGNRAFATLSQWVLS